MTLFAQVKHGLQRDFMGKPSNVVKRFAPLGAEIQAPGISQVQRGYNLQYLSELF
jgi:hypothetical protein